MADKAKEEIKKREEAQREYQEFIKESYTKLWRWQLEHNTIVFPFMIGPWVPGNQTISPELGFRKMGQDEREQIEKELAAQSGIIIPK